MTSDALWYSKLEPTIVNAEEIPLKYPSWDKRESKESQLKIFLCDK